MYLVTPFVRCHDRGPWIRRLGAFVVFAAACAIVGRSQRADAASPDGGRPGASHRATGRIEGLVEISTSLTARRPQIRIYAEPGSGVLPPPAPRDPIVAELHNVVVYLEEDATRLPVLGTQSDARAHASMAQRDERFLPHVLSVLQGSVVDFPNEDDVYHNVFSLSSGAGPSGRGFDLGRYPKGSSRSVTFSRPGIMQVFCHIHADMKAFILVMANPFFASPGEDHRFVIDNVPEGDYTIVAWHERIKPIVRHVHVVAGQTAPMDFNIPLPQGGSK